MKLRRFARSSSVFVCLSIAGPVFAATIVVDNDFLDCPQADFNSIQLAVNAAQPGDKILVCPGLYVENPPPAPAAVLITKSDLRIEAQGAPGEVVLQGTPAQEHGFQVLNTTGVLLQGFTVQDFGTHANIEIQGGRGNTLRKNITKGGVEGGIHVFNSSANVVEQNTSFNNRNGIFVGGNTPNPAEPASDNIIRHNETYGNRANGIAIIFSGPRNVVFGNRSYDNALSGVLNAALSHENVIENNHVFANDQAGIQIANSTAVTARNNRSESNTSGIRLANGAANNLVEKNEIFKNTENGVLLQINVDANTVQLNLVRSNGRDGIRIFDAASNGNRIERNVMRENVEHDAHDDGTANVWINNKCETEDQPGLCKNPDH